MTAIMLKKKNSLKKYIKVHCTSYFCDFALFKFTTCIPFDTKKKILLHPLNDESSCPFYGVHFIYYMYFSICK